MAACKEVAAYFRMERPDIPGIMVRIGRIGMREVGTLVFPRN